MRQEGGEFSCNKVAGRATDTRWSGTGLQEKEPFWDTGMFCGKEGGME